MEGGALIDLLTTDAFTLSLSNEIQMKIESGRTISFSAVVEVTPSRADEEICVTPVDDS